MIAYGRLREALLDNGNAIKDNGFGRIKSQCPAHTSSTADSKPLTVTAIEGSVLLYCHAGCDTATVLDALGLGAADLFDTPKGAEYVYPGGRRVLRTPAKNFPQSGNKTDRSLFRADRIPAADHILIVEGEKDCLAAEALGATAVCSAMGAGKAHLADWTPLRDKAVTVVADNDEPGRKHAAQVIEQLRAAGAATIRLAHAAVGKDLADHIAAGKPLDELVVEESPDGAQVLDAVEAFIRRFCILPGEHCYVAAALWAAHTHFIARLETTPRLACLSPEPGSGKTRVLEVFDVLAANPLMALDLSMAAFFRIVEDRQPTILLDEVDAIFTGKKQSESAEDMRRVINNGYRIGAVVQRVGGKNRDEVQDFHVFTPVAMAGLGNLPDTLMSRSVIIRMKRRSHREKVQQYRDRLHRPEGEKLQERLTVWSAGIPGNLPYPELPDGVEDRDADCWEPLIMVADLAGGDWPTKARAACLKFIAEKPESSVSLGVRLLTDLKRIWPDDAATMSTADILDKLADLDEAPWADLYGEGLKARKLAQLLGDYDIKSRDVRTPFGVRKGYRREDLWDSWLRYVPSEKGDMGDKGDIAGHGVADGVADGGGVADGVAAVADGGNIDDASTCANADVAYVADSGERKAATADPARCADPECGYPVTPGMAVDGMHPDCARRASERKPDDQAVLA